MTNDEPKKKIVDTILRLGNNEKARSNKRYHSFNFCFNFLYDFIFLCNCLFNSFCNY